MKISQGKLELHTSKSDAIDKLMQLQGVCSEENSNDNPIEFYCTKSGNVAINNPPTKFVSKEISTKLFGKVIVEDGKTYLTYSTTYSSSNNIIKIIYLTIMLLASILGIFIEKTILIFALILACLLFGSMLSSATNEKGNASNDSEILIKELEKRVDAVNNWDK